jgi:hypothetical protein
MQSSSGDLPWVQPWPASLILPGAGALGRARGRGGGGEGRSALVLDAACLHLILHYVSLSHISILLWGSPSIQKRLVGSRIDMFALLRNNFFHYRTCSLCFISLDSQFNINLLRFASIFKFFNINMFPSLQK